MLFKAEMGYVERVWKMVNGTDKDFFVGVDGKLEF